MADVHDQSRRWPTRTGVDLRKRLGGKIREGRREYDLDVDRGRGQRTETTGTSSFESPRSRHLIADQRGVHGLDRVERQGEVGGQIRGCHQTEKVRKTESCLPCGDRRIQALEMMGIGANYAGKQSRLKFYIRVGERSAG